MTDFEQWKGFEQGKWCDDIDTRDFIQKNYTPYDGYGYSYRYRYQRS